MDQLLRGLIAREPIEVVPIPILVLHFTPLRLPLAHNIRTGQVFFLDRDDLSDRSILHAFHGLPHRRVIAPAKPRDNTQPFLSGGFAGGLHQFQTRHIEGMRLFAEHVLAGIHSGLQMHRVKMRGGGN